MAETRSPTLTVISTTSGTRTNMPVLTANRAKIVQIDFTGGHNSGDDPSAVKVNQASTIENSIITKLGKVEQRKGLALTGDNPATLISKWTFDASTAVDDKGSNDGTATGVTYVAGKFGQCASFNGTTSSISVPADSTIDITSMGACRLSAWVYVDSDGENDTGRIFDKWSGTKVGFRLWTMSQSGSTVKLTFEVGYGTTNAIVVTSTTMSTGAWHKVDAIHNADKSLDIAIDGAIASYSTDTTGVGTIGDDSAVDLYLGNNSAGDGTFDGEIDDMRIYDGAFTADSLEIKPILGLTTFAVGATYNKPIRAIDTKIQELNSDYLTWDDITGLTALTADKTTNFVQGLDKLFILNGTDNVHSITSALAVTDEGNTNTKFPRTTFAEWTANNRMFASGSLTVADRDIVWFSNALDPQTWVRDTNFFKVRSGSGGKVTWLKMFKEFELIIYKEDSIYVLNMDGATPLTDWNLKPLSVVVGCPAGRTVQNIGNDQIYLANDGVRLLSRTAFDKLKVGVISDPIRDILDDTNQDAIENSVGYFENGLYLLGVPRGTSTTPNQWLIWDSYAAARIGDPNGSWTVVREGDWDMSCMTSFGFGENLKEFVGGDARSVSLCYKVLNGNTDNGATVVQNILTREIDFGEPFAKKIFDPVRFVCENGSDAIYLYSINVDNKGFSTIASTGTLSGALITPFTTPATTGGSEVNNSSYRSKFAGKGSSAILRIQNSVYNKRPTFIEYELFARGYQGRI